MFLKAYFVNIWSVACFMPKSKNQMWSNPSFFVRVHISPIFVNLCSPAREDTRTSSCIRGRMFAHGWEGLAGPTLGSMRNTEPRVQCVLLALMWAGPFSWPLGWWPKKIRRYFPHFFLPYLLPLFFLQLPYFLPFSCLILCFFLFSPFLCTSQCSDALTSLVIPWCWKPSIVAGRGLWNQTAWVWIRVLPLSCCEAYSSKLFYLMCFHFLITKMEMIPIIPSHDEMSINVYKTDWTEPGMQ